MAQKLTELLLQKKNPTPGKRLDVNDTQTKGFGVRIVQQGKGRFFIKYRIDGRQKRRTLGAYHPERFSLADARKKANAALDKVERGIDPFPDPLPKSDVSASAVDDMLTTVGITTDEHRARWAGYKDPRTFSGVALRFLANFVFLPPPDGHKRPEQTRWTLERYFLEGWGKKRIEDISKPDVVERLRAITRKHGSASSQRAYTVISKMWREWVKEGDWREDRRSPCQDLPDKLWGAAVRRDRILDDDEVKAIWTACDEMGYPFGPFYKLLLLTGQRRSEVSAMRWDELDLEQRIWAIPAERTKSSKYRHQDHFVPLSDMALKVLADCPRHSDYVFSSRGNRPICGYSKAKAHLDKLTGIEEGWRVHDFRRTVVSGLAALRIPELHIQAVVNHAPRGVTQTRYMRHNFLNEKSAALQVWADQLKTTLDPVGRRNVVKLPTAGVQA